IQRNVEPRTAPSSPYHERTRRRGNGGAVGTTRNALACNGNFEMLLDWNLQPIIVARGVGPDFGGRDVLDVTDINAGQVNAVDPQIELPGRPMRKVEPELLTAEECVGFGGVPTVKDALLPQLRHRTDAGHLPSAVVTRSRKISSRRKRGKPLSC